MGAPDVTPLDAFRSFCDMSGAVLSVCLGSFQETFQIFVDLQVVHLSGFYQTVENMHSP